MCKGVGSAVPSAKMLHPPPAALVRPGPREVKSERSDLELNEVVLRV